MALVRTALTRKRGKQSDRECTTNGDDAAVDSDSRTCFPLLNLPNELIVMIACMLPKEDHIWLAQANKHMYSLFHHLILSPSNPRLHTGSRSFTSPLSRLQCAINDPCPPSDDMLYSVLRRAMHMCDAYIAHSILLTCPAVRRKVTVQDAVSVADRGHLVVFQLLIAYGCIHGSMVYKVAACRGHLHILRWLHDNGYRGDAADGYTFMVARTNIE